MVKVTQSSANGQLRVTINKTLATKASIKNGDLCRWDVLPDGGLLLVPEGVKLAIPSRPVLTEGLGPPASDHVTHKLIAVLEKLEQRLAAPVTPAMGSPEPKRDYPAVKAGFFDVVRGRAFKLVEQAAQVVENEKAPVS